MPPSRAEGARWLERAANQGYVEAQAQLATLAIHGLIARADGGPGTKLFASPEVSRPDFETSLRWARKAADGGSADGQAVLGYILTSGPEPMRDLDEAHRWYERSAAAGCPQGALGFALSLARDATDPEQQAQVAEHLRRAADAGLPTALYLLALMTERGMGMPADRAAAIQLFRQAAEKGNRPSQARWGMALMQGDDRAGQPGRGRSPGCAAPHSPAIRRRRRWSAISTPRAASCRRTTPRRRCGSAAPRRPAIAAARAHWACCI